MPAPVTHHSTSKACAFAEQRNSGSVILLQHGTRLFCWFIERSLSIFSIGVNLMNPMFCDPFLCRAGPLSLPDTFRWVDAIAPWFVTTAFVDFRAHAMARFVTCCMYDKWPCCEVRKPPYVAFTGVLCGIDKDPRPHGDQYRCAASRSAFSSSLSKEFSTVLSGAFCSASRADVVTKCRRDPWRCCAYDSSRSTCHCRFSNSLISFALKLDCLPRGLASRDMHYMRSKYRCLSRSSKARTEGRGWWISFLALHLVAQLITLVL